MLYLFVLGVPIYRSRQFVDISLKSGHKAYLVFREAIYDTLTEELNHIALSGQIEMDETMFGGKRAGKRGWGATGKQMVFGMYMRNGQVLTFPIQSRSRSELMQLITSHTTAGSLFYTDDWHAYGSLPIHGNHVVVTKEKGKPKGRNHLNGIEGFWSYAKNWLYQYRGIPQHHFHLYLKEIEFRFNHREKNLFESISKLLVKLVPNAS